MLKAKKTDTEEKTIDESPNKEKTEEKSSWIKIKPQELEKMISDLAKQGNSPSKIGIILRDKHAVPKTKLLGKKLTNILKKEKITYIKDQDIINKKVETLKSHITKNKYDHSAKRSLAKQLWLLHNINKNK